MVLHDTFRFFAENPPSSDSNSSIAIALIGVGGSALAGLFVLLNTLAGKKKEPAPPAVPSPPPPVALNSDMDDEEEDEQRERNRVLERWCYRHGYDPTLIVTGEEPIADVRIRR